MTKTSPLLVCGLLLLTSCGGSPDASLSLTSMSFGRQVVGTLTNGQTIMLSNTGSAALRIDEITVALPFLQTNTCGSRLAAGANCTIDVSFAPSATGEFSSQSLHH